LQLAALNNMLCTPRKPQGGLLLENTTNEWAVQTMIYPTSTSPDLLIRRPDDGNDNRRAGSQNEGWDIGVFRVGAAEAAVTPVAVESSYHTAAAAAEAASPLDDFLSGQHLWALFVHPSWLHRLTLAPCLMHTPPLMAIFEHPSAEHLMYFFFATFFLGGSSSSSSSDEESLFLPFEAPFRCGLDNDMSPWLLVTGDLFRVEGDTVDFFFFLAAAAAAAASAFLS
jgi:hypothetical protein